MKMRSSCAYSARPSVAWTMWLVSLGKCGGIRDALTSIDVGRHSHEVDPSWSCKGVPMVQSATGSRAAMPTRSSERRHSSSRVGLEYGLGGASARGRPEAFSAMLVLSRLASSLRIYSGKRGFPPAFKRNVSAIIDMEHVAVEAGQCWLSGVRRAARLPLSNASCCWKKSSSEWSLVDRAGGKWLTSLARLRRCVKKALVKRMTVCTSSS